MTQLKSLAHPEWPYAGSAHEWRGFVRDEKARPLKDVPLAVLAETLVSNSPYVWSDETRSYVYQKQNFGPELP